MKNLQAWGRLGLLGIATGVITPCSGQSEAVRDWVRQIALGLNEHGHLRSQASGQSAEATVGVTLDDLGRLVSTRVVKKTGTLQLDEAALAVISKRSTVSAATARAWQTDSGTGNRAGLRED